MGKIKYPLAFRAGVQIRAADLTPADVTRGKDMGIEYRCLNPLCPSPLMFPRAVGSTKYRPHFAHLSGECRISEETLLHLAAKDILKNHPQVRLPGLQADPYDVISPEIQPARNARWSYARDEIAILGRWRADIVLDGEMPDPTFIILEDDNDVPLVVEIVVTSPVAPAKIEAVQNAGWRMMAIRIDQGVAHPNLYEAVTRTCPREWLAHPEWRESIRRERERLQQVEDAKVAQDAEYVRDIIDRMQRRRPIDWTATRENEITDCIRDNDLYGHIDGSDPYGHWTAGESRWWRTHLVDQCLLRRIKQGEHAFLPSIEAMCDTIVGFVIPHKRPNRRMLAACGVDKEGWGSTSEAILAFVNQGLASGLLEKRYGQTEAAEWLRDLALRNQEVDSTVLSILYEDNVQRDARQRLRDWRDRNGRHGMARRDAIIQGGEPYLAVLEEARIWRDRLQNLDMDAPQTGDIAVKPPISIVPKPVPVQAPNLLDQVEERNPKPTPGVFNPGLSLSGGGFVRPGMAPASRSEPPKDFVSAPWTAATAAPRSAEPTPIKGSPSRDWQRDLHTAALAKLRSSKRTRDRAPEMAALFMRTTNPRIGGRPVDLCVDQRSFDECTAALRALR